MSTKKSDTDSPNLESLICENCRTVLKPGIFRCECGHRNVVEVSQQFAEEYMQRAKEILKKEE